MNTDEIKKIIPHRYPFLLIDKVESIEAGKSVHAVKCVTATEPWFQGHFPKKNIMPGVLIIESIAQAGAVSILSMDEFRGKTALFSGIKEAKFRKGVFPGDILDIYVEILRLRKNYGTGIGRVLCGKELVAEARIGFFIE